MHLPKSWDECAQMRKLEWVQSLRNGEGGWVKFWFCKIFLSWGLTLKQAFGPCFIIWPGWKAFSDQQAAVLSPSNCLFSSIHKAQRGGTEPHHSGLST